MKNALIQKLAILVLALACALSLGAMAQTTDDSTGPTDQPDAPLENGQDAQPPVEAQPGGPSGEAPAQTDQGVARISLIHGDVSTQRGDSNDWSAATLNQPMMTGDKISTAGDARAEVQLDFANILRVGENSQANISNLTKKNIQIQLGQGIATYSVSRNSEAEPEIDTPNVSVHPSHNDGVFRVEVRPDGDTLVIVRQGEAQISTPQGSTEVRSGEMATVRGDYNSAQYKITSAPDRDDWDRWNSDRDHLIYNANSWRHTNRRYTGTQDLDAYGHWRNVPDYGDVWYPDEPADWVPYRDGNWVWEPYYGWTWVGYEPWGWAPYHYGRWFWYGGGWGWWPGPVYAGYNPFWAPAYVSFWGWGGGWGFGFGWGGWGGFGWLPLGPCDWYHPWWGGYRGRFGVVNVTNVHITNITNINRYGGIGPLHGGTRFSNVVNIHDNHIGRALSTVHAGNFGAGQVRAVAATREQIGGARMMAGNLPVVPTRASLSASGRAAAPSTVRNGGSERFFGAHNNVARPASFEQQTASLRQTMQQSHVNAVPAGGRANGEFQARGSSSMQRPSAGTPVNRQVNNSANRSSIDRPSSISNANRGGFRPFNAPSNGSRPTETQRGPASQIAQRGGYRPFNAPNNSSRSAETQRGTASQSTERGGYRPFNAPNNSSRSAETQRGTASQSTERGGYRPFTPPSRSSEPAQRENPSASRIEPPRSASQTAPAENRGGYRPFTAPSQSQAPRRESAPPSSRPSSNYWNRSAPSSTGRSGSYSDGFGRGSSRPQLDMRQPIVRGPSSAPSRGGYSAPSYGGSRGMPSYGGSRSAPSYGGSHSAPSYGGGGGGRSYGGGGGGGHPSGGGGGGGHASGGGGGHSGHR